MTFDLAFGLILAAIGAAVLLLALVHPSPQSVRFIRTVMWPRGDRDRTDLALTGWLFFGLGAFYVVLAADVSRLLLLIPFALLVVSGIALGVRRRDV